MSEPEHRFAHPEAPRTLCGLSGVDPLSVLDQEHVPQPCPACAKRKPCPAEVLFGRDGEAARAARCDLHEGHLEYGHECVSRGVRWWL